MDFLPPEYVPLGAVWPGVPAARPPEQLLSEAQPHAKGQPEQQVAQPPKLPEPEPPASSPEAPPPRASPPEHAQLAAPPDAALPAPQLPSAA